MKRLTLLFCLFMFVGISFADPEQEGEEIILQTEITDPTVGHTPIKKSPVLYPSLSIKGHTLFFTRCSGSTLRLLNEEGDIEYTTVLPYGTNSLMLPSYLSGEYMIQIIRGRFCFWGYVDL